MLNWLKSVIDELFTPSSQGNDWYGWTTNQISHAFLGTFAFWALLFLGCHVLVAFSVPLCVMLIKESIDLMRGGSTLTDSLTDFLFVLYGVFSALFSWDSAGEWFLGYSAVMSLVLLYGIRQRVKRNATETA